ncbi:MAG: protein-L-isoaspartate(D-aspartate) O-methyltransferase [Planctomycetes bacterium]|nr:protein-L-isoaspartate(D-aspartate) O-methyltransferase [Planctomycetota bacterium]
MSSDSAPRPRTSSRVALRFVAVGSLISAALLAAPSSAQRRDPFQDKRNRMVATCIEREGIKNPRVLESMRQVPRHEFVDSKERVNAYVDCALPIGYKQTISPPFVVAYMTETIDPQTSDKILEIGTGSGYQAAVLSNLCKEVYSIEIVEPLGKQAAERLKKLGYTNVTTKVGDGYLGWAEHAPFDKIIVTCSPENVPQALIDQLKDGGKLLVPLGERYQQVFHMFEKTDGKLVNKKLISTLFVPMTGQSEAQRQVKPDPSNPTLLNGSFEEDEDDDGQPDHWHYQRLMSVDDMVVTQGKKSALFESHTQGRIAQALQAMAIDGTKIGGLGFEIDYKTEGTVVGKESWEIPGLMIHFYDDNRKNFDTVVITSNGWLGTSGDWREASRDVIVPARAREMIIRVGLNGATGKLWVDGIKMTVKPR